MKLSAMPKNEREILMKKSLALLLAILLCMTAFTGTLSVTAAAPTVVIENTTVSGQAGGGVIVVSGSGYSENTSITLKLTVPSELTVVDIDGLSEYDADKVYEDV